MSCNSVIPQFFGHLQLNIQPLPSTQTATPNLQMFSWQSSSSKFKKRFLESQEQRRVGRIQWTDLVAYARACGGIGGVSTIASLMVAPWFECSFEVWWVPTVFFGESKGTKGWNIKLNWILKLKILSLGTRHSEQNYVRFFLLHSGSSFKVTAGENGTCFVLSNSFQSLLGTKERLFQIHVFLGQCRTLANEGEISLFLPNDSVIQPI